MRRQIKGFLQMNHYNHLTTNERENLLFLTAKGYSIRKIATILRRSPSTVSREIRPHWQQVSTISAEKNVINDMYWIILNYIA